jgi:SOS-response transcriptional repressor LexA
MSKENGKIQPVDQRRIVLPLLTRRQELFLAYLKVFHHQEDRLPSTREMREHMKFNSQNAAIYYIRTLVNKGYLECRNSANGSKAWWRFSRQNEQGHARAQTE